MAKVLSCPTLDEIISFAQKSDSGAERESSELVGSLTRLKEALDSDSPELSKRALSVLHALAEKLESENIESLQLKKVTVPGLTDPIRLLLTKAVFSPEFWGRTFAEGLLKAKEQFRGRKVLEVGTGSGWISILLLLFTHVKEVVGLDLNPVAVTMARLNTWLNGTNSDGTDRLSLAGEPIVQAFRVEVSDLLQTPLARGEFFDHVVGCIPQVLHPKPVVPLQDIDGNIEGYSEKDLYDLSNYCFEQGILEDRFGLPLIASALEQSQLLLNAGGKVTLVLGGRPGRQAIESMFERRGFDARLVWMRRIQQADDTDLASLVELEKSYGIRFHFFMSRESDADESVSAKTAVKLLSNGRPIYHDLLVYEANTRFEPYVFDFVRNLSKMGLSSLRKELDFSRLKEERVSFLSRLSQSMMQARSLPYPHERGDMSIRELLARYLEGFCYYPVKAEELFVAPSRAELAAILFKLCSGTKAAKILLSSSLTDVYLPTANQAGLDVTVGNDDLSELCELDDLVAPSIVLISPKQLSAPSPITIKALCQQAAKHPDRVYLIDDSQNFLISSNLGANMTLRLAAQENLPPNLILLYGLVKNILSPDLQLSFLVNAPLQWLPGLDVGAELTYSRIAYPTQLLYQWLFEDLMTFAFNESAEKKVSCSDAYSGIQVSELIRSIEQDPVFLPKPVDPEGANIIRLDYGEFEAPPPDILVKSLFKGFIDEETAVLPQIVQERVCSYVNFTRHVGTTPRRVVLAQGVFPLFGAFVQAMKARLGRAPVVGLPSGSYGPLYPMLEYYGAQTVEIKTSPEKAYLLSSRDLQILKESGVKLDVLWITQPNNPSGVFFDPEKLRKIVEHCHENDIYIFSDEIFFLLSDHRLGRWTPSSLSTASFSQGPFQSRIFMVDGVAKSFASGGMRLGFMLTPSEAWAQEIQSYTPVPPLSLLRAWDGLYSAFLDRSLNHMLDVTKVFNEVENYLMERRRSLSQKREQLLALLRQYGLDDGYDTPYRGGLFLLGKLSDQFEPLAKEAGLLINPGPWGRCDDMARLCFCLEDEKFQTAYERLKKFLSANFVGKK